MKFKQIAEILVYVSLVSCNINLDREYVNEIKVPDTFEGPETNFFGSPDTILIRGNTQILFDFNGDDITGDFVSSELYLDDELLAVDDFTRTNFYMESRKYGNGYYILKYIGYARSGTGSLADKLGAELVEFTFQKVIEINNQPLPELKIINTGVEDGQRFIEWEPYQGDHFEKYVISHGIFEPIIAEITDKTKNKYFLSDYFGGREDIRLLLYAISDMSASSEEVFDDLNFDASYINGVLSFTLDASPYKKHASSQIRLTSGMRNPNKVTETIYINDVSKISYEKNVEHLFPFLYEAELIFYNTEGKYYNITSRTIEPLRFNTDDRSAYSQLYIHDNDEYLLFEAIDYYEDFGDDRITIRALDGTEKLSPKTGDYRVSRNGQYIIEFDRTNGIFTLLNANDLQPIDNYNLYATIGQHTMETFSISNDRLVLFQGQHPDSVNNSLYIIDWDNKEIIRSGSDFNCALYGFLKSGANYYSNVNGDLINLNTKESAYQPFLIQNKDEYLTYTSGTMEHRALSDNSVIRSYTVDGTVIKVFSNESYKGGLVYYDNNGKFFLEAYDLESGMLIHKVRLNEEYEYISGVAFIWKYMGYYLTDNALFMALNYDGHHDSLIDPIP